MVLARVDILSDPAQRVLQIAAVAGQRVDYGVLASVSGRPVADLVEVLREAVAHHVQSVEPGTDSYAFRHALVQEAIYDDLLPAERAPLHAAYAQAVAGRIEARAGAAPRSWPARRPGRRGPGRWNCWTNSGWPTAATPTPPSSAVGSGSGSGWARALINRPTVLLADEPTGALDSRAGEQVMDLLLDLNQIGQTLLLVTHDEQLALRCASRVIRLADGRVAEQSELERAS